MTRRRPAASALSRVNGGEGPSLIYLCEPVFDTEQFLKDVQEKLEQKDSVLVAISEGIHDSEGRYVSEQVQSDAQDQFGHSYIAGSAKVLEELVRDRIGCKVRSIELNLMQRCAAHLASATDLEESRMLGMKACQCALEKQGGQMASIRRISADPYRVEASPDKRISVSPVPATFENTQAPVMLNTRTDVPAATPLTTQLSANGLG